MTDLHGVNDTDDRGVDGTLLATESHSSRAALHDQNRLVNPRADCVDSHHVTLLVFAIDVDQPRNKQLSPVKAVVLPRRYYGPNYSSKKHD